MKAICVNAIIRFSGDNSVLYDEMLFFLRKESGFSWKPYRKSFFLGDGKYQEKTTSGLVRPSVICQSGEVHFYVNGSFGHSCFFNRDIKLESDK